MLYSFRRYRKDLNGATAVEAAFVFPLIIVCLFMMTSLGGYMFGKQNAQRSVDLTARQTRIMSDPTQEQIKAKLLSNLSDPLFGSYTPTVSLISKHGGTYAELKVVYKYTTDIPLAKNFDMQSESKTQVLLRSLPG